METFKQYIKEMAYPINFSFEEFNAIKTYNGKLKYANTRLQKIASGSARVVYKVDELKVLKIAKNRKGLAQNSVEAEYYLQNYDIIAKVFETCNDDFFVEMELAKKVSPSRFKALTGLDLKELDSYLRKWQLEHRGQRSYFSVKPEVIEKIESNEFASNLMSLIGDYDMEVGDYGRASSWGEVLRNGKPTIVLIDFGLTRTVWEDFYKVSV